MATLAELLVDVDVDAAGVEAGIDKADRAVEGFGGKLGSAGKQITDFGKTATTFATVPLLGLAAGATKAAEDLGESVNAIGVVFGPAADKIEAFGETADQVVGLSTRAFNELVAPVGASLQNVGFSADEAADASINLAKRAADMASVFNVDVADAMAAIQAGLRGEADPLEQFGVGLSAAAVTAHALEMGLGKTEAELTDNEKAQARLSLLMEQTDKIAGDFANTVDSTANSERVMRAEAENAAAAFGQKLLPIKAQLVAMASRLIDRFNALSPSMQNTILKVAGLVAAAGPALIVLGSIARAVSSVIRVVTLIGGSLLRLVKILGIVGKAFLVLSRILLTNPFVLVAAAVIALAIVIIKNWDKIRKTTVKIFRAVWGFLKGLWDRVFGFIKGIVTRIAGAVSSGFNAVLRFFRQLPGRAISAVMSLNRRLYSFFRNVLSRARDAVVNGAGRLINFVRSIPGRILRGLGNLGRLLWNAGRNIIGGLIDGIQSMFSNVMDTVGNIVGAITDFLPFSPAKRGPMKRKPPHESGESIARMLADGLAGAEGLVVRAAEDIARAAAVDPQAVMAGVTPRGVARAERGPIVIELRGDGSARADFLINELREQIREISGGDVELALGRRQ